MDEFKKLISQIVAANGDHEIIHNLVKPIYEDACRLQHLDDVKNDIMPFYDPSAPHPMVNAEWLLRTRNGENDKTTLRTFIDDDMAFWESHIAPINWTIPEVGLKLVTKPTIPDVSPLIRAWYAKPGNECGGMFHIILDDGNHEQHWANGKLEEAKASGDPDAISLAERLQAMSPTQRLKLSKMNWFQNQAISVEDEH